MLSGTGWTRVASVGTDSQGWTLSPTNMSATVLSNGECLGMSIANNQLHHQISAIRDLRVLSRAGLVIDHHDGTRHIQIVDFMAKPSLRCSCCKKQFGGGHKSDVFRYLYVPSMVKGSRRMTVSETRTDATGALIDYCRTMAGHFRRLGYQRQSCMTVMCSGSSWLREQQPGNP